LISWILGKRKEPIMVAIDRLLWINYYKVIWSVIVGREDGRRRLNHHGVG